MPMVLMERQGCQLLLFPAEEAFFALFVFC